ncbi:MAG: hypothetical protein GY781_13850 [Gammaproteobacteria bacterium]|nr:hypothetical protein [Gammaproteobacteria bacterium]
MINDDQVNEQVDYVDGGASSGQADVDVSDGTKFAVGDEVVIYDGQDSFETALIDSISSNTLTMSGNLVNTYPDGAFIGKYLGFLDTTNNKYTRLLAPDLGDGSDGAFVSSGNATWSTDKNYTSITIQNGHTITVDANIEIKCQGAVTIESGGKLSAKGEGHAGGAGGGFQGYQGTSQTGAGTTSSQRNDGGGGGGASNPGAGGGGGYATNGIAGSGSNNGEGGTTYNDEELTTYTEDYLKGSGGGGASWSSSSSSSPLLIGGAGGGIIKLFCKSLTVAGEIDCDGVDGLGDGSAGYATYSYGGSGGGAGGTIYIIALNACIMGSSLIHADGGSGGTGYPAGRNGGNGGDGRIRVEAHKITGTTSPTYVSGYNTNIQFTKYGWYHTQKINALNDTITANAYVKQEIVRDANISGATSSGQKDVIVDDASVFNAGDKVVLIEDDKMEIGEIDSILSNTLTLVDNLTYSYTASGDVLGVDNYAYVSLEPVDDDESQVEMNLQSVENLSAGIWYFTWSKTVQVDDDPGNGEPGVNIVGKVRLQGKDNNTVDVNLTEINWSYY